MSTIQIFVCFYTPAWLHQAILNPAVHIVGYLKLWLTAGEIWMIHNQCPPHIAQWQWRLQLSTYKLQSGAPLSISQYNRETSP